MYTNTDCTVYVKNDGEYTAIYVPACYWQEVRAAETKKYGAELADSVKAIIPAEYADGLDKLPREGTFIAKGIPGIEITDSIEPLLSADISVFAVSSVTDHRSGSEAVQHITICGR
ncbi:MAG: hypothetical protein MR038_03145 [Oscillospiraceae bacterium]|nr:hypothetical protein [Oscillospiraceae bacterium]